MNSDKKEARASRKVYQLDTSIILDSFDNLFALSKGGENVLVITDVNLKELDYNKEKLGEVGFQAREFYRAVSGSRIET
ncbi:MAG: hypothetical protein HOG49_32675, partial [Candidatus Scalindua sp.]|nr:hypothetical protein [Candidatus Scalindua sp.]